MAQEMAPTATADCDVLMRLFLNADGLTPAVRQLMIEGLPHAIRVNNGKPHVLQSRFITIVADMLREMSRDTDQKLGAHKTQLELLEKHVEEGTAANDAAMKAMEDATRQTQELATQLKEREEATQLTQLEHEQALREKALVDERQAELEMSKADATSTLDGPFQLLVEGQSDEPGHIKTALETIKGLLKRIGTEPALVAAAGSALGNKPAARGEFDVFTIECVKQTLEMEVSKISALIADHQAKYESVTAEQLGLWALLDHERARQAAAQASHAEMELHLATAQSLHTSTQQELTARSNAVSQKVCEHVVVDQMAKELGCAHEAVVRLAAFCY
mmetsp:Transcript_17984/g.35178  ORF Transcript_17984/g.35178 Transcript_17984/m.35178 type:complete len:334 (+) Transcript_17984:54-1055(+)